MNHKYGFHVNRTGNDVLEAIKRVRPRVIKTLDPNVGFWREVRDILPDLFLIGRIVVPGNEQDQFVHNPAATGANFARRILNLEANKTTYQGRLLFDAWESYNEIMSSQAPADLKRAYDDFQVAFAGPIKQAGLKPIAMNFGTGNMLGDDFVDHFRGTLETYKYLGFHEYDWPAMWRLHEKNIREKNEGGMWLTLRYRRIMTRVRQVYPGRHIAIVTECGMTQGVLDGKDLGWLHAPTVSPAVLQEVKAELGIAVEPHVPEDSYWQSLQWYNDELQKDDYVLAALLFVVGAIHPWESFEHLGGIVDRLARFQEEEPDEQDKPNKPDREKPEPDLALGAKLLAEAARAQVIQFNPRAALQKKIFADGFVPNSPEFHVEHNGVHYVAQRAEHLGTGQVRVYHVRQGDWGNVAHLRRGEDGRPIYT
jgi:hypothetical protein